MREKIYLIIFSVWLFVSVIVLSICEPFYSSVYTIVIRFVACVFCVAIISWTLSTIVTFKKRMKIYSNGIISLKLVKTELFNNFKCKKQIKIILSLLISVVDILACIYTYFQANGIFLMCLYFASNILLWIYVWLSLVYERRRNSNISIVCDTMRKDFETYSDSEGEYKEKIWKFCKYGKWKPEQDYLISFKKKVEQVNSGTKFYIAINSKNKILRLFDSNEFRLND